MQLSALGRKRNYSPKRAETKERLDITLRNTTVMLEP